MSENRFDGIIFILIGCFFAFGCSSEDPRNHAHIRVLASVDAEKIAVDVAESTRARPGSASVTVVAIADGNIEQACADLAESDLLLSTMQTGRAEETTCRSGSSKKIRTLKIGHIGIVIASAPDAPGVAFTEADLYRALAAELQDENDGGFVPNQFHLWSDVNHELPPMEIRIHGPKRRSPAWNLLIGLIMEPGCKATQSLESLDSDQYEALCRHVRDDGAYMQTDVNSSELIEVLRSDSMALALVDFGFIYRHSNEVKGSPVGGDFPDIASIADGNYPLSRTLILQSRSRPNTVDASVQAFVNEITDDGASGKSGYLIELGMLPMSDSMREQQVDAVRSFNNLK